MTGTSRDPLDRERLIGLVAAPVAAAIAFVVTAALVANDPATLLADGKPNPLHVAVSHYQDTLLVLLALSILILVMALWRKRLYLGMVAALYGVTLFNLRYYGFALPFVLGGAWLIVRAYRDHRALLDSA
jgi:hypothetical protein